MSNANDTTTKSTRHNFVGLAPIHVIVHRPNRYSLNFRPIYYLTIVNYPGGHVVKSIHIRISKKMLTGLQFHLMQVYAADKLLVRTDVRHL